MVALGETQGDTLSRNASKWKEADGKHGGKNGRKRCESPRNDVVDPLSEPRYRGSNPCLPANTYPVSRPMREPRNGTVRIINSPLQRFRPFAEKGDVRLVAVDPVALAPGHLFHEINRDETLERGGSARNR